MLSYEKAYGFKICELHLPANFKTFDKWPRRGVFCFDSISQSKFKLFTFYQRFCFCKLSDFYVVCSSRKNTH